MSPNTAFLSVAPDQIDTALRHVERPESPLFARTHRGFCLCTHPMPHPGLALPWVSRCEPGVHFIVDAIKTRPTAHPYIVETVFVVVRHGRIGNRLWDALGASGFFAAIGDNHPRADIDFARHHPDTAHFACMDDAVRAAVAAIRAEG